MGSGATQTPAPRTPSKPPPATTAAAPRTSAPNAALAGAVQDQAAGAPPRVGLGAPVAGEVLLKGASTFAPPKAVADYLATHPKGGGDVNVRFPGLAAGAIKVVERKGQYSTPAELQAVDLVHPALEPLRSVGIAPMLAVKIENNTITGFMTVSLGKKPLPSPDALIDKIEKQSAALGWIGMSDLKMKKPANKLEAGTLTLSTDFGYKLGGFLVGTGSFGLSNDVITFAAHAKAGVKGLGEVALDAERKPDGTIHGRAEIPISLKSFSGNLVVTLAAGVVEVIGTAKYTTDKLTGEVTILVTDAQTAKTVAYQHLPPEAIAGSAKDAAGGAAAAPAAAGPKPGPRAVAGWGTIDAHFNEWLTGKAMVIVDADGDVTVIGKITPPARVEFPQTKVDWEKPIFAFEVRAAYGIPVIGNVFLFAGVSLAAIAKISPLVLSKIEVVGTYSTKPEVFNSFSLSANLNISALAALRMRAEGGVGIEVLDHDVKIGAAVNALAGIKGYVDATPLIGYRELADPKAGKRGEFYIHGEAVLAAQPFLGLSGDLFVKLDSPWWSPAPDKTWTWPLGELEYPLPGEFGFGADVDYIFGSGKLPTISPKKVDFNADRFMGELMDDKVPSGSTGEQTKKGAWNEKQKLPPVAPAPPKVVDTKGKKPKKDDKKVKEAGTAWSQGMKAVAALKARGETQPYAAAELMPALGEIKKKHGFSELKPTMAGDVWVISATLGKDSLKKPIKIKRAPGGVSAPTTKPGATPAQAKGPDQRTADQKAADAQTAVDQAAQLLADKGADITRKALPGLKEKFSLKSIDIVAVRDTDSGEVDRIEATVNPRALSREVLVTKGMDREIPKKLLVKYGLEGLIGPYGSIEGMKGDRIEGDHQPQKGLLWYAAQVNVTSTRKLFANTKLQKDIAPSASVRGGQAINLTVERHRLGRTWGSKSTQSLDPARNAIDAIVSTVDTDDNKRTKVIAVIRKALNDDVAAMVVVIKPTLESNEAWQDIMLAIPGPSPEAVRKRKFLIAQIRAVVGAAEARMKAQNLKSFMDK